MVGWLIGMIGVDVQQESWRYFSNSVIEITKMAVAASVPQRAR